MHLEVLLLVLLAVPQQLLAWSQCNDVVLDENGKSYIAKRCLPQFRMDDLDNYYNDDVVAPPRYKISRGSVSGAEGGGRFSQGAFEDRGKSHREYGRNSPSGMVRIISAGRERDPEVYLEKPRRRKVSGSWKYINEDVLRELAVDGTTGRVLDVGGGQPEKESDNPRKVDEREGLHAVAEVEGSRDVDSSLGTSNASIVDAAEVLLEGKVTDRNAKVEPIGKVVEAEGKIGEIVTVDGKVETLAKQSIGDDDATTYKDKRKKSRRTKGGMVRDDKTRRRRGRRRRLQEKAVALTEKTVYADNSSKVADEVDKLFNINVNENKLGKSLGKAVGDDQAADVSLTGPYNEKVGIVEVTKRHSEEDLADSSINDDRSTSENDVVDDELIELSSWKRPAIQVTRRRDRMFDKRRSDYRTQEKVSMDSREQLSPSRASSSKAARYFHSHYGHYPDHHEILREAAAGSYDRRASTRDSNSRKVLLARRGNAGYRGGADNVEDGYGDVGAKLESKRLDWRKNVAGRAKDADTRRFIKNVIDNIIDYGNQLVGKQETKRDIENHYYYPVAYEGLQKPRVELEYYWP